MPLHKTVQALMVRVGKVTEDLFKALRLNWGLAAEFQQIKHRLPNVQPGAKVGVLGELIQLGAHIWLKLVQGIYGHELGCRHFANINDNIIILNSLIIVQNKGNVICPSISSE